MKVERVIQLTDKFDFSSPLADRLRPTNLDDIVGQEHLVGENTILRNLIEKDCVPSMILWGPPGIGKTTLAEVISLKTKTRFVSFSAVLSGIKEIRQVMKEAEENLENGIRTTLFIDEIHRFNKSQQDAFLPFVEKGSLVLIGATTENPSFELNNALISRCRVFVLKPLEKRHLVSVLKRALSDERGFGKISVKIDERLLFGIAEFSNGDARKALSVLETAVLNGKCNGNEDIFVSPEIVAQCVNQKTLLYDKTGEEHYNLISALHKSMRNSDPDAALYWLARMLESGEDPSYVARRIVRFASEDIGLADSNALNLAVSAFQACRFIGMPECCDALAQAVIYLSVAPKSNAVDVAYSEAKRDAIEREAEPVPLHLRNAVTFLTENIGYGRGYDFAHDHENRMTKMKCLPDSLLDREYYRPTEQGLERKYIERVKFLRDYHKTEKERI